MIEQLIEELKKKKENQQVVVIDYVIEKLENIHLFFEVARTEVIQAIENMYDDEDYEDYKDKLDSLTDEDINRIAWKVEDYDVWDDLYYNAKNEISKEIGVGSDAEY